MLQQFVAQLCLSRCHVVHQLQPTAVCAVVVQGQHLKLAHECCGDNRGLGWLSGT